MAIEYRFLLSHRALVDLVAIHKFIATDSPDHAAEMIERILVAIDLLKTIPHRQEYRHRRIGLPVHSLPVRPYIIYFSIDEARRLGSVVTIRHAARRRPRFQ